MHKQITDIINLIKGHDKIAFFHHVMIDGDSFSSSYGLMQAVKKKFPHKQVKWVANRLEIKNRFAGINFEKADITDEIDEEFLAIIGDCAGKNRIYQFDQYQKARTKIAFDHHTNDIDFDHDLFWHEPTWIASSVQAAMIAEALDVEFDEELAINLLYGIITDSGRFAFSGADPLPLEVSARLMRHISNKRMFNLYELMNKKTLKGLKFESWVYDKLQIKEKVGFVKITKQDQQALGLSASQVTRVNLIANIEGEKVWIFFVEYEDFIRVEFRSNGVAVNEIAQHFNGGGHIKASGCRLQSMNEADAVITYAQEFIKKGDH